MVRTSVAVPSPRAASATPPASPRRTSAVEPEPQGAAGACIAPPPSSVGTAANQLITVVTEDASSNSSAHDAAARGESIVRPEVVPESSGRPKLLVEPESNAAVTEVPPDDDGVVEVEVAQNCVDGPSLETAPETHDVATVECVPGCHDTASAKASVEGGDVSRAIAASKADDAANVEAPVSPSSSHLYESGFDIHDIVQQLRDLRDDYERLRTEHSVLREDHEALCRYVGRPPGIDVTTRPPLVEDRTAESSVRHTGSFDAAVVCVASNDAVPPVAQLLAPDASAGERRRQGGAPLCPACDSPLAGDRVGDGSPGPRPPCARCRRKPPSGAAVWRCAPSCGFVLCVRCATVAGSSDVPDWRQFRREVGGDSTAFEFDTDQAESHSSSPGPPHRLPTRADAAAYDGIAEPATVPWEDPGAGSARTARRGFNLERCALHAYYTDDEGEDEDEVHHTTIARHGLGRKPRSQIRELSARQGGDAPVEVRGGSGKAGSPAPADWRRARERADCDLFHIAEPLLNPRSTAQQRRRTEDRIKFCLERGAISLTGKQLPLDRWYGPGTPLSGCLQARSFVATEALLKARANPNFIMDNGVGVLHCTAWDGQSELCQLLCDKLADPNLLDKFGQTPLFFAQKPTVCDVLLKAKADVSHVSHKGQSAVHLAAQVAFSDVLLWHTTHASRALLRMRDGQGQTVADYAHSSGVQYEVLAKFLEATGTNASVLWKTGDIVSSSRASQSAASVRREPAPGGLPHSSDEPAGEEQPALREDEETKGAQIQEVWRASLVRKSIPDYGDELLVDLLTGKAKRDEQMQVLHSHMQQLSYGSQARQRSSVASHGRCDRKSKPQRPN